MPENKTEENEVKEVKRRGRPKKQEISAKIEEKNEPIAKVSPKAETSKTKKTTAAATKANTKTAKKQTATKTAATKKTITKKSADTAKSTAAKATEIKKKTSSKSTKESKPKTSTTKRITKTTLAKKTNKEEKVDIIEKIEELENEPIEVKKTELNKEKMEKIENEINKQTKLPEETKRKINAKVFKNIVAAIIVVLYFIFINLGYKNIEADIYLTDLKVFSAVAIGITIVLFEKAYKKDSDEIAKSGIEMLVISIATFLTIYVYKIYNSKFIYIMASMGMLFAIYYVAKSIKIYVKMKKTALEKANDVRKIVEKVEE